MKKSSISYHVLFTPATEGGYTATVPILPGCISEGDSFEEASKNIAEAISLYLEVTKRKQKQNSFEDFIVAPIKVFA